MFTVYKITNLKNNKSYIGSSIRVDKRWKQHIRTSKNPNSSQYNYPLYRAFRKYGINNFSFDVLKDDFNNQQEMQEYQHIMIIYFNSVENGYNQTYQTIGIDKNNENFKKMIQKRSQRCAKINIDNQILEIYSSYHDAARKNGSNEENASRIRKVCKGLSNGFLGEIYRDLNQNNQIVYFPIKKYKQRKKIIGIDLINTDNILYFDSISEASRKLSIPRKSLSSCINGDKRYSQVHNYIWREIDSFGNIIENNQSLTVDNVIEKYNYQHPLINGERHSISQWCKIYNISNASLYKRLKKGMTIEEAITTPKRR